MAVDIAGNQSGIVTETYTIIDTIAPDAPPVDLDAASDSGISSMDNVTNDATPAFSGAVEAGSTVKFFDGAGTVPIGSATAGDNGRYNITASALADGSHSITAMATDPSGNESVRSGGLEVRIDTVNPNVSATPGAGSYPRTQSVKLVPSETASVYFTRDGSVPNPGTAGTFQATGPVTVATTTTLKFIAVDTAGNRSAVVSATYKIQNARPVISNFGPTGRIADRTPRIVATITDSDSQLIKANITLVVDGRNIPRDRFAYAAATDRLTYQSPLLSPGNHKVSITVRDVDGGVATRNWKFTIR